MPEKISEKLISSIIEKGIDNLGESPKKMLWTMLEQEYGFTKENTPKNLLAFLEVLQKIFGLGYSFLDSIFKILLEQSTGESLDGIGNFAQCVSYLRQESSITITVEQEELTTLDNYIKAK